MLCCINIDENTICVIAKSVNRRALFLNIDTTGSTFKKQTKN